MALAVVLTLIAVGAVAFQLLSPWWLTPLASNWKLMDDTLLITLVITGVVFVAINLFMAWAIIRYRHRPGHRAAYEPHNKKLEWWLTGVTSAGIVAMLAPGLWAYADLIDSPKESMVVEVLGQQWQWRYRLPGNDGRLGTSDVSFVSGTNPFGLNPKDRHGQDDVVVAAPELHIPVGKPVKLLQRSHDVLHNFYVPQFRVKMDLVPGLVSQVWFTPTVAGRYEVMCAEYCGLAHANMRSHVVVEDEATFKKWLAEQPTFAQAQAPTGAQPAAAGGGAGAGTGDAVSQGRELATSRGCTACHTIDGKPSIGPTWLGLYGKTETLVGGGTVKVDDAYLKKSITEPTAQVVQGFPPVMPPSNLNDREIDAVIEYMKSVK
jgi:cytochrome c oxidase subunit 2